MEYKEFTAIKTSVYLMLAMVLLSPISVVSKQMRFLGSAYRDDGQLVYKEEHEFKFDDAGEILSNTSTYFNLDGDQIAFLKADYNTSRYTPQYEFIDFRGNESHGMVWQDDKIFFVEKEGDKLQKEQFALPYPENMVSGQGLHFFIVDNFDALLNESSSPLKIDYLIPTDHKAYTFRVGAKQVNEEKGTATILIDVDNWFFRLFAPSMLVTYDIQERKLLNYRGPTAIKKEGKEIQTVRIEYQYFDG